VLKAGAAYLPIDTEYPEERKAYILRESGVKVLLTDSDFLFKLSSFEGQLIALDIELSGLTTSTDNLKNFNSREDLAYVLYTSGSTGRPKGCQIEHKSIINYILWAISYYFSNSDSGNFGLYTSSSFDLTVTSIFCS